MLAIWLDGLALMSIKGSADVVCDDHYGIVGLMSIYECTMVDSQREPTPYVRCTNVEMVDTEREPTPYVRCTNVEILWM